jgi:hypothetical protein
VEDWEQFFEEKSRRRADKGRRRARSGSLKTAVLIALVAAAATGALLLVSHETGQASAPTSAP